MEMLRVANVIEEGRYGGPQSRIAAVAEKLRDRNIETVVILPERDSEVLYKKLCEKGILTRRLSQHRLTRQKAHFIKYVVFFIPEVLSLYRLLKSDAFDVVHVNGSYQIKSAIAGKIAGVPIVWHLNDTFMAPVIRRACILVAKYCAAGFIVAGERVYDYYIRGNALERKPCIEINAPVDTGTFDPCSVMPDERIASHEGIKILTVANINPVKGLEFFIEMAYHLNVKYKDLNFFIGGEVYNSQRRYHEMLRQHLVAKKLRNVTFLGRLDDVASALKSADICVYTSLSEASPTAVWESMAMGKPTVTTDVGSVRKYIEDGKSGFVVPVRDSESLAQRVELLIEDASLRERVGREARAVAMEKLDLSVVSEKHALFYQEIAANHSSGGRDLRTHRKPVLDE